MARGPTICQGSALRWQWFVSRRWPRCAPCGSKKQSTPWFPQQKRWCKNRCPQWKSRIFHIVELFFAIITYISKYVKIPRFFGQDQPRLLRFREIVSTGSIDHWFQRLTQALQESRRQEPVDVGSTSTGEGGKGQQGQTSTRAVLEFMALNGKPKNDPKSAPNFFMIFMANRKTWKQKIGKPKYQN